MLSDLHVARALANCMWDLLSALYVPLAKQRTVLVSRSALDGPSEQLLRWSELYGLPGVGQIDVSLEEHFMMLEAREQAARTRERARRCCEEIVRYQCTSNLGD